MRRAKSNRPPKVVVDARPLQGPSARRGIGRYVAGLLAGFTALTLEERVGLLIDRALPVPAVPAGPFVMFAVGRRYRGRLAAYEDWYRLPGDLDRIGADLYHATSLSLPGPTSTPVVATLHDLIPWALGGFGYWGERIRHRPARRGLRLATRVIAVSQHTAADAHRLAGVDRDRLVVIPEGVDARFGPRPDAGARVAARFGLTSAYLLYAGALDRRKDPPSLLSAWRRARLEAPELQLVLAGDPGPQAPSAMPGAVRLGYVTDDELADLMAAATAFVFPSRYEGFGLPVLEAMACGCPVVAYANSSVAELLAGSGLAVADGDRKALGEGCARVVTDPAYAASLKAAGLARARAFDWESAARRTWEVYRAVLAGAASERRPHGA